MEVPSAGASSTTTIGILDRDVGPGAVGERALWPRCRVRVGVGPMRGGWSRCEDQGCLEHAGGGGQVPGAGGCNPGPWRARVSAMSLRARRRQWAPESGECPVGDVTRQSGPERAGRGPSRVSLVRLGPGERPCMCGVSYQGSKSVEQNGRVQGV
jgi:hypothetical protein